MILGAGGVPNKDDPSIRPFACTVEGCMKRYKNLNGLKVNNEKKGTKKKNEKVCSMYL